MSATVLKLLGEAGSEIAATLAINLTDASFQAQGTVDRAQQRLKILCKANNYAGHLLKILYGIQSKGDGDELLHDIVTERERERFGRTFSQGLKIIGEKHAGNL